MQTSQFITIVLSIFGANFASMLFLTSRLDRLEDKLNAHIEWHMKAGA